MKEDLFCCPHCFRNKHIQRYIEENYDEKGHCCYCDDYNTVLISVKRLGQYFRECINKAYEICGTGTGSMWDSEEKEELGPDGNAATTYSIRRIMVEEENVFSEETITGPLLEDLFENVYTAREIQKGSEDNFAEINSEKWVIKNDLYGSEQTRVFQSWETFKHIVKHYNRFFDSENYNIRGEYLERMDPYIYDFVTDISKEMKFFRARKIRQ